MRRINRVELPFATRVDLYSRQKTIVDGESAQSAWTRYRGTVPARAITETLARMAGFRQRCMYCRDSLACAVEHFRPKATYPNSAFIWTNFLWICDNCNRRKGNAFPCAKDGKPLIINPIDVDPWSHFILDSASGEIAARWLTPDEEDPIAVKTLEVITTLTHEAVVEGRFESIESLTAAATACLDSEDSADTRRELLRRVSRDVSGAAQWFTSHEGRAQQPWQRLSQEHPRTWRRVVSIACA